MKKFYLFLSILLALCMGMVFPFGRNDLLVSRLEAKTTLLETGWEDGEILGQRDGVIYSRHVAGYYNTWNPPPECSPRYHETVRSGDYALMIAGYSQASYAYCYYRAFDHDIPVQEGLKIGYWIYHTVGTARVSVDGHFTDGTTIRDFHNNGYLTDQHGVRIHPGARRDPMNQWHYVEVDLSKAAGKTIDFIMFAFDNGNDGFRGQYRAYVDDFEIFTEDTGSHPSITGGLPKGPFGSGGQTDEVTEPETWRWSEWFYGHQGIDEIAWQYDGCGGWHNYAMGWHQGDLIEYLMKFGGDYSRLILQGIADRPGPVEVEIYIDGQYMATAAWDNNDDCNQDAAVEIGGIPYGTHAIAVKFTNDYYNRWVGDRNFYLDGLLVTQPSALVDKSVVVLVHHSLFSGLATELDRFKNDLLMEGVEAHVREFTFGDHIAVKDMIVEEFNKADNLIGAILIGNIPHALAINNWQEFVEGICDYYYMDLDGEWLDTDNDGVYDKHGPGRGDRGPEIWCGRLYASTVNLFSRSELTLYREYFRRNHLYRTGALPRTHKALHYTNNPSGQVPSELESQALLYPGITLVESYDIDQDGHPTAEEAAHMLRAELAKDYEWIHITAHAWSYGWSLTDPNNNWSWVDRYDIKDINPRAFFYNTHSCGSARFLDRDYVAGVCLFSDYGLTYLGFTTSSYYPPEWDVIYSSYLRHTTFGSAFKAIYDHVFDNAPAGDSIPWTGQEMILLGDPTLKICLD